MFDLVEPLCRQPPSPLGHASRPLPTFPRSLDNTRALRTESYTPRSGVERLRTIRSTSRCPSRIGAPKNGDLDDPPARQVGLEHRIRNGPRTALEQARDPVRQSRRQVRGGLPDCSGPPVDLPGGSDRRHRPDRRFSRRMGDPYSRVGRTIRRPSKLRLEPYTPGREGRSGHGGRPRAHHVRIPRGDDG